MRAIQKSDRSTTITWTLFVMCLGAWSIGCVLENGDGGGDGLFDDFNQPPVPDDQWMEESEERRRERDDPRSTNYRGDFEVKLQSDRVDTAIDGASLGEATFEHVGEDLAGTPPHCQITLADREPDATGSQGYLILQVLGDDCDLEPGEFEVFGSWQEARRQESAGRGVVLKTVQITVETDAESTYYDYRQGEGTLEITQVDRGDLIQAYLEATMTRLTLNDDPEQDAALSVEGGFGAVNAP